MARSPHRTGHRYRQARAEMFRVYGTVCHLCGHEGADSADHLEPVSLNPQQVIDPHAMRPAHGVDGCPTCGRACNQSRGNREGLPELKTSQDW
jgi:hypothetical protein